CTFLECAGGPSTLMNRIGEGRNMPAKASYFLGMLCAAAAMGCAAVNDGSHDTPGSTSGSSGTAGAGGGGLDPGDGGSTVAPPLTDLYCSDVPQEILVLDFRSGWWSGGGGGEFHQVALAQVAATCTDMTVEYHHFEVDWRIECFYTNAGGSCQQLSEPTPTTPEQIEAIFGKATWDDYTQVWLLSGSEMDATDVALTGQLFQHFLNQTSGSCVPVLVGAGDGFITHGNAVTAGLGLGDLFSTD